ncbi:MAG: YcxB family protein [Lachnospiraceae bacterium]|nr:YcxB family protein [Lachnospiraceae bacterium]
MLPYTFSVKVQAEDLRYFNLYSFYHRPLGFFATLIGILMFFASQYTYLSGGALQDEIVMTIISLVVLLYMPLSLSLRAKGTISANPIFSAPLNYSMEEEGLRFFTELDLGKGVSTESKLRWESIYKVVRTRHELLVFSNQVNAFVIPLREIQGKYETIRDIFKEHVEDHKLEKL